MALNEPLIAELEREAIATRKIFESIQDEHWNWKPHEKSYTLGALSTHIADITGWVDMMIHKDELDFANTDYVSPKITNKSELMQTFEENLAKSKVALQKTTDEQFSEKWRMRNGEQIYFELPKDINLRTWVFSHIVHHRAQLGVYLRLLNVAVPTTYGPTADEQGM